MAFFTLLPASPNYVNTTEEALENAYGAASTEGSSDDVINAVCVMHNTIATLANEEIKKLTGDAELGKAAFPVIASASAAISALQGQLFSLGIDVNAECSEAIAKFNVLVTHAPKPKND